MTTRETKADRDLRAMSARYAELGRRYGTLIVRLQQIQDAVNHPGADGYEQWQRIRKTITDALTEALS